MVAETTTPSLAERYCTLAAVTMRCHIHRHGRGLQDCGLRDSYRSKPPGRSLWLDSNGYTACGKGQEVKEMECWTEQRFLLQVPNSDWLGETGYCRIEITELIVFGFSRAAE